MTPHIALRGCILLEITLAVALMLIGVVGEPFLPEPLRAYVEAQSDAALTPRELILLPLDLLVLALAVTAWVGLWRGWRKSRRLYTAVSALTLPLLLFHPADVASGVSNFLEATAAMVAGVILGLLYFSELRHRYEDRPKA